MLTAQSALNTLFKYLFTDRTVLELDKAGRRKSSERGTRIIRAQKFNQTKSPERKNGEKEQERLSRRKIFLATYFSRSDEIAAPKGMKNFGTSSKKKLG